MAFTCGGQAEAESYATASALAVAIAETLSQVYVSCAADDGSYACAEASGFIETSAMTVAEVLLWNLEPNLCALFPDFHVLYRR